MKYLTRALVALTILAPTASLADTRTEITDQEGAFYNSFLEADADAMEAIFADDFLYQHGSGQDFDETSFLQLISSGTAVVTRADTPELRIQDFGDTVVTSGASRVEGRIGENPFGGTLRFVNVWHREGDTWQLHHRNSEFVE